MSARVRECASAGAARLRKVLKQPPHVRLADPLAEHDVAVPVKADGSYVLSAPKSGRGCGIVQRLQSTA